MKFYRGLVLILASVLVAAHGLAGNIVVASPTTNQVIGATTNVTFNITGAVTAVTVKAVLTGPGGVSIQNEKVFTTFTDGKINDSLSLNLDTSAPEGAYSLQVTATENNATYNTVDPIPLTVVLKGPKMLDFSPLSGTFVKGIVPISVSVQTNFIKDYKVQIDNQDIPNNSGTTTSFVVNWDTSGYTTDGAHTINITVRDQANNSLTQTINVTVDRLAPSVTITYPVATTRILPRSTITFVIDVQDANGSSVAVSGIDVQIKNSSGVTVRRVPRLSFSGTRWIGRIRPNVSLPTPFTLVVDCVDKAGNRATTQSATYTIG